jgi:hypothetical protein
LIILVVALGGVDLLAGARRASLLEREGRGRFDDSKLNEGAMGKAVILLITLIMGMSFDTLVSLFGGFVDLGFSETFRSLTPVTASMLLYRFYRESASIQRNVETTPGGKDALWPGISKLIDSLRFQAKTGTDAAPERRWTDELTAEERDFITKALAERRKGEE